MATLAEIKTSILSRFLLAWGSTTEATFDNENFTEPESDAWIRLVVRNLINDQETLGRPGNRKFRSDAIIFVQLFTPLNAGTQQADQLSEQIRDIFQALSFDGVHTLAGTIREIGPTDKWYQVNIEIPFFYEQIK